MLSDGSDRCLSVCLCPVCLSIMLVYCGQTVGWIKMKLGMEVGLGAGHIVSYGDSAPPPPKGRSPHFLAHVCCGQMAEWVKMPLGREVGLGPGDIVLDGDPAPPPKKGHSPPLFGPCVLWQNGWMNQDATWYEGRPRSSPHCVRCGPSLHPQKGAQLPTFRPMTIVAKWSPISATAEHLLFFVVWFSR